MKKLLLIFSLFIALNFSPLPAETADSKPTTGFVITVTAENAGGEWIYISRRTGGVFSDLDSAKTTVFPVVLKGKQDVPEMLYLRISGANTLVPVFVENSEIRVFTDFENPPATKVEGSAIHKEYELYTAGLAIISSEKEAVLNEWKEAGKTGDEPKIAAIELKYEELDKKENEYNRNFVLQNPASFVTPFVIRRGMFYTLELDELKSLVASLDVSVSGSVYTIDLKDKIAVLEKVAIGQKYTDIVLPGVDGTDMSLSAFIGKNIVLVDFWASWCGPCRRENPNVVKIYQDYHDKGFDIVGVSFDTNEKGWKDAIQSDGLVWHHMSDLKGWNSKAAELYAVAGIPHTVLIGKDGLIIAKNLQGDALKAKLADLLD